MFSDLHQDCYKRKLPLDCKIHAHPKAQVIVLAGDIDVGHEAFRYAYELAQRVGKHVIFVPGNHEYYYQDYLKLTNKFRASARDGVHVLLNSAVVIDGTRFCGGTLWTDFELYSTSLRMPGTAEAMAVAARGINDFRVIRDGKHAFTPEKSLLEHQVTRAYLDSLLDTPFEGKTVVVTHHAPHPNSIHSKYAPGSRALTSRSALPSENSSWKLNACFASDLTSLVEKASVWVHGHTHDSFEYTVGKCRVFANPRGYPIQGMDGKIYFENSNYNPMKLIEV